MKNFIGPVFLGFATIFALLGLQYGVIHSSNATPILFDVLAGIFVALGLSTYEDLK